MLYGIMPRMTMVSKLTRDTLSLNQQLQLLSQLILDAAGLAWLGGTISLIQIQDFGQRLSHMLMYYIVI